MFSITLASLRAPSSCSLPARKQLLHNLAAPPRRLPLHLVYRPLAARVASQLGRHGAAHHLVRQVAQLAPALEVRLVDELHLGVGLGLGLGLGLRLWLGYSL